MQVNASEDAPSPRERTARRGSRPPGRRQCRGRVGWLRTGKRDRPSGHRRDERTGHRLVPRFTKPWTEEIVRAADDDVVAMGCGDACPVYPGKHCLNWTLDAPPVRPSTTSAPSATRSSAASADSRTTSASRRSTDYRRGSRINNPRRGIRRSSDHSGSCTAVEDLARTPRAADCRDGAGAQMRADERAAGEHYDVLAGAGRPFAHDVDRPEPSASTAARAEPTARARNSPS